MKSSRPIHRTVMAIAGILLASVSLLSGCRGNGASGDVSRPGQTDPPFRMSIMAPSYSSQTMTEDGEVFKQLEEKTNTRLNVNWVPISSYEEKLSATVASGEMPTVIAVLNPKLPYIINSVRSGMFWELGPYLKDYPNLSKLDPNTLNNASIDGKIYSLYRERDLARNGIMIRKDWLDNLHLQAPTTINELVQVLRAFTQDDPDKDNKQDTIGLAEQEPMLSFKSILLWMGGPNGWEVRDGSLSPSLLSPTYLEALEWYKKLYEEKLINQDFPIVKDGRQLMSSGKAGVWIGNLQDGHGIENQLRKVDPNAEITMVNALNGPLGLRSIATEGYTGVFMIPKSSVKNEAELRKVLAYFDRLADKDMQMLLNLGIEGRQYTVDHGTILRTTNPAMIAEYGNLDSSQLSIRKNEVPSQGEPLIVLRDKLWKENENIAVTNPVFPLISNTYVDRGSSLDKLISDAQVKFITGAIDEAGWKNTLNQWLQGGGSQIMKEYTEAYLKTRK